MSEEIAQNNFTLFLEAQNRAMEEHKSALTAPEKAYWQGVKDGLRKCYAIFANDPGWEKLGGSSLSRPVAKRI